MSLVAEPAGDTNAGVWSVSELAFALKRTLESEYGFVRLRGELSKVSFPAAGHCYLDIKDDKACIAGVVWKSQLPRLAIRPQTGLEVIVTGKITTYPGRSQYQIIIDSMAAAGVGALLAQLERLKAKLQAEGLFAPARKRPLPAFPEIIGVVTSPTGAVIRDILHRLAERWPCRVLVWPVAVQGDAAAREVASAILGFASLAPPLARPQVLIVARGGGSVEDLWAFNDEALARVAAASPIPLVSAIGHETDTTLIDFVSDRRAPTPSAAAEIATPVRAELVARLAQSEHRIARCVESGFEHRRHRLSAAGRALPRPADLLGLAAQRLDHAASRLGGALQANIAHHRQALTGAAARASPRLLTLGLQAKGEALRRLAARLGPAAQRVVADSARRLISAERLRLSLDPKRPLELGFARVFDKAGRTLRCGAALATGQAVGLEFYDVTRQAVISGPPRPRRTSGEESQGQLF